MELAVTTVFVSPIVKLLIAKVLTYCSDEIALVRGVKGELEKLSEKLELIDAVLHDAEKRQVENDRLVRLWLKKLKDVAYDAEDILNELQYRDLRCKMKNVSIFLRLLPSKPFGFGCKIAHKIKDVHRKLVEITQGMEKFKFIKQMGSSGSNTAMNENIPETSSHISDSAAVVGRKDDISRILDLLIDSRAKCNQESYSVVRITGMGGIGKTTLAQLVWKELADDHFKVKIWVSVSRKSNVKEIFWDLLESNFDRQSSMDAIENRLKERFKVGKCLVVLDDVWTNYGIDVEKLLKVLLSGMRIEGSKIVMTAKC
ncbi:putative disease resistance protein RGA4 [Papaver somniferum]|uniref:putative disease resistance protein RGA4 n=1 Tax=Papaver somniferum TaxID=3469 RepID=UPI000E6FB09B|nr:putative disease resistance protein RGA4 [Papaver somniferum]